MPASLPCLRHGQGTIHKHAAHERRGAGCQGGEAAQLFGPRADRPESPDPRGGAPTKAAISIQSEVEPTSTAVLIREYGVIHIKNALTMEQQTRFWKITKPRRRSCRPGHKGFQLCSVRKEWQREAHKCVRHVWQNAGSRGARAKLAAEEPVKQTPSESDCSAEPSYQHLQDIWSGKVPIELGQLRELLASRGECDKPLRLRPDFISDDLGFG